MWETQLAQVVSGFLVGGVVGVTGVGGGALMTPVLLLVFGVAPSVAIGTDLLFAATTKSVGVVAHRKHQTIDWMVVRRLAAGSIPAALLTTIIVDFVDLEARNGLISKVLALMLLITAVGMYARPHLHAIGKHFRISNALAFKAAQLPLTVIAGAILGVAVTLTSVGAGALGAAFLSYLYPLRLTPERLVGTDLAHAIPLAVVAGIGHWYSGFIDWPLLLALLIGSVPGVLLGVTLSVRIGRAKLQWAIATVLSLVGVKLLLT